MKEFQGKLEKIAPGRILNKIESNDLDNFFLVLGLIYNDLKGLISLSSILEQEYQPKVPEITPHFGEYSGIQLQLNRLIISLVSEFLVFIEKNKTVINSPRFLIIEKNLPREVQIIWRDICSTAISPENSEKDSFYSKIARVRSNIVFHYDHSGTQLRSGFVKKFFEIKKDESNTNAIYSLGEDMPSTRFYYCDGAVQEYLKEHLTFAEVNYLEDSVVFVGDMNKAIFYLMKEYIKYKEKK